MCVVCTWCVWACVWCVVCEGVCVGGVWAETERHSQAKDNVHGWIFCIICLCFLSSFITSVIKTTPMKCESATLTSATIWHLYLGRQTGECSELGREGEGEGA